MFQHHLSSSDADVKLSINDTFFVEFVTGQEIRANLGTSASK